MNVSSGLVEIGFNLMNGKKIAADTFYVWPHYNAGRVENIHGISRRNESAGAYYRPSPDERDRIQTLMHNSVYNQYSPSGGISRSVSGIRPGLLFDEVA